MFVNFSGEQVKNSAEAQIRIMSRFFAGGSDSDSESDSDREQVVVRPQAPAFTVSIVVMNKWNVEISFNKMLNVVATFS